MFPALRGTAPVWFLPHLDHTLSRREGREEVTAHIQGWRDDIGPAPSNPSAPEPVGR